MWKIKIKDLLKFTASILSAKILAIAGLGKDIWLITERRNECKDNGYHLFKYIRENDPSRRVYYVIDKDSKDITKIKHLGNIIYFDSFRHYVYAHLASRLIGAFSPAGIPDSMSFYKFPRWIKGKKVFLQHGITKEQIESLTFKTTKVDLFVCGAKPEYDFVNEFFGYPQGTVNYLGFCRYDNLAEFKTKKQILVMPTWRQTLPSQTFTVRSVLSTGDMEQQFIRSDYYKHYSGLLSNKKLFGFLEKNGYVLIFYLHHELQQFVSLFKGNHANIVLASNTEYDVQQLLKESEFLITDYSSIAFDFAYMKKPLLYYQFDEVEYYKTHYAKGYFEYESMGFGPVVHEENQLIDNMLASFDHQTSKFVNREKYAERTKDFFQLSDTLNCKRTYEAIINL